MKTILFTKSEDISGHLIVIIIWMQGYNQFTETASKFPTLSFTPQEGAPMQKGKRCSLQILKEPSRGAKILFCSSL